MSLNDNNKKGSLPSDNPFAEVIESSLTSWLAQSWKWDSFPSFGSLVLVQSHKRTLFGIVYEIQTGSMDPTRYPFAYQKTEEELLQEQPQIFEFLKTSFKCLTIGYQDQGTIIYQVAPEPPKIHSFVGPVCPALARDFFSSHNYLHLLFASAGHVFSIDELLLAIFKEIKGLQVLNQTSFEQLIETFRLLTGNDYRRLKLFLQRAETI